MLGLTEQPVSVSKVNLRTIDLVEAVAKSPRDSRLALSQAKASLKKPVYAIHNLPSETPSKQASNNKLSQKPTGEKNASKPRVTRPKSRPNVKSRTPLKIETRLQKTSEIQKAREA